MNLLFQISIQKVVSNRIEIYQSIFWRLLLWTKTNFLKSFAIIITIIHQMQKFIINSQMFNCLVIWRKICKKKKIIIRFKRRWKNWIKFINWRRKMSWNLNKNNSFLHLVNQENQSMINNIDFWGQSHKQIKEKTKFRHWKIHK